MLECARQEIASEHSKNIGRLDINTKNFLITMLFLVIMVVALTACGSKTESKATQPPATQAPTIQPTTAPTAGSDGEALLNARCTKCHNLTRVISAKKTAADWAKTVTRMISNGAKLTTEEQKVLVDYLAKTYAP